MKDLLRLLGYVRPYLARLFGAVAAALLVSLTYLALFSLIQPIFDEVLPRSATGPVATAGKIKVLEEARRLVGAGGDTFAPLAVFSHRVGGGSAGTAVLIAVLVVFLYLFKGLCTYLTSYLTRWTGLQAVRDLRSDLYARIQRQSLAFFSEHPTGHLISRVMGDVGRLQNTVSGDLADIFRLGAIILGQTVWLYYLNWKLAGFCLVLLPLVIYPVVRFGRRLKSTSARSMERMGDASSIIKEGITGTRIVQSFGMEPFEIGRFDMALERMQRSEKKAARILSIMPPVMELIGAVGAGILFAYAAHRISIGKLSPGEFATFIAALFMIYQSLRNLVKINNGLQSAMAAAHRVFHLMDQPQSVRDAPDARELPQFREKIEFRGVSFGYGRVPVLHDIDLTIPAGNMVALVGSSGAGKSSLVNLLPRFYDVTAGAVLLDGHDVRSVTLASLRRQIGLVTQEVILFDGTVRDNIAYGRGDIPQQRVVAAAEAAYAHGFITELAQGYDTPLGEAGARLSLGQRQRLSIARAILKDAPILILDEATSSLDAESEAVVQAALHNLMTGRTVFVIAHRLATVRRAEVILVLESGRIVERGTHADLLALDGSYARQHALQFRDERPASKESVL
jgi:subfamily B ATP-binding cassette protein MsbA